MNMRVSLGNPFLIFLYSLAVLLLGCAIGLHWKGSPTVALSMATLGAVLMVIHDMATGVLCALLSAKMLRNAQQGRR